MDPDQYLKHGFKQSTFLGALGEMGTVKASIKNGVCQTLALKWIEVKLKEVAAGSRETSSKRMGSMTDSIFEVAALHGQGGGKQEINPMASAEKEYSLKTKGFSLVGVKQCDTASLSAKICSASQACYLYRFTVPSAGAGHAIAMYQSSGKAFGIKKNVYTFDPNHGEYKVPSSSYRSWLEAYLKKKYKITHSEKGSPPYQTDELIQYQSQ